MGSMDITAMLGLGKLPEPALGPRGGDLNSPLRNNEARRSEFKPNEFGMHRGKEHDSAREGLVNEQPWHTMAAYMLLAGRTNSEIALAAGRTPDTVSVLRTQRWFQQKLALLANAEGDDILGTIKSEALASVQKIVEIRDTAESDRVALSAAQILLEHSTGKPTQKIVSAVSHSVHKNPADEMAAIEQELAALRSRNPNPIK